MLYVVVIVNENDIVVINEIWFGDNDWLFVLVVYLVGVDVLVLLLDIDGFYDCDLCKIVDVMFILEVFGLVDLDGVVVGCSSYLGIGGMVFKVVVVLLVVDVGVLVLLVFVVDVVIVFVDVLVGMVFVVWFVCLLVWWFWVCYVVEVIGVLIFDVGVVCVVV